MKLQPLDQIVTIEDLQEVFSFDDSSRTLFYRDGASWRPACDDEFVQVGDHLIRIGRVKMALRRSDVSL